MSDDLVGQPSAEDPSLVMALRCSGAISGRTCPPKCARTVVEAPSTAPSPAMREWRPQISSWPRPWPPDRFVRIGRSSTQKVVDHHSVFPDWDLVTTWLSSASTDKLDSGEGNSDLSFQTFSPRGPRPCQVQITEPVQLCTAYWGSALAAGLAGRRSYEASSTCAGGAELA